MNCKCKHEKVCQHSPAIFHAVSSIIELRFGGTNPDYEVIASAVRQVCKFREPIEDQKENNNE